MYQSMKIKNSDGPIEKWTKAVGRQFIATQIQMAHNPMKQC